MRLILTAALCLSLVLVALMPESEIRWWFVLIGCGVAVAAHAFGNQTRKANHEGYWSDVLSTVVQASDERDR